MKRSLLFMALMVASCPLTAQEITPPYGSLDVNQITSIEDLPWEIQFNEDFDHNGAIEITGTILLQQFATPTGTSISFDYTILTSEGLEGETGVEGYYMVHDLFRVGLWALDSNGHRTGQFEHLLGVAATNSNASPYTGDYLPADFANGGDYPGFWTLPESIANGEFKDFFSQGAVTGSFFGYVPPGNWELEFLVAHSEDVYVTTGVGIDNVLADGLRNGDFENGLQDWFYIGWADVFSNRNGPNAPIVNSLVYNSQATTNPNEAFLPSPGGTFNDTFQNTFVGIGAPGLEMIPEPSTYLMGILGLGICSTWFWRRRRLIE